jgi:photosystem II stability/assembly factor-like uncharacterized protein
MATLNAHVEKTPTLYAGTANGLHILQADPDFTNWRKTATRLTDCDLSAIGWDARNPAQLLVGTADGRLFRSTDSGASWQTLSEFDGRKIWAIADDPNRPSGAFYIGLDGGYLHFTPDYGATFTELTGLREVPHAAEWWGPFGAAIFHSILPVPGVLGKIYLGLSVVGVLYSADEGRSWQDITGTLPGMPMSEDSTTYLADVHKLALHPTDPHRLYVTMHEATYRSDDGGTSWQNISAGLPFEMTRPLALHPTDPDTVFVITHDSSSDTELPAIKEQLTVHRSRDAGRTWEALTAGLPNPANCSVLREALAASRSLPFQLYLGTNKGQLFASTDMGDSWQTIGELGSSVRFVRPTS